MAHFAELDDENIVLRVIVISNDAITDDAGIEIETVGIEICRTIAGGTNWKQTSYNHRFRKQFGTPGSKYDPDLDIFIAPQPAHWFVLNSKYDWVCPDHLDPETGQPVTEAEMLLRWLDRKFDGAVLLEYQYDN